MQQRKKFLAVAGFVALASTGAKATMLEQLDTVSLTKKAKWIHVGEVARRDSVYDSSSKMVYTYVKMRVEQTLKGEAAQEVTIRVPGGQADGIGMVVHGMANFRTGEKAIVFLRMDSDGAPSVVGMSQGKFSIIKSKVSGEEQALFQAPSDVEFFTKGQQGKVRHVVATQVDRKVPLNTFLGEIRNAVTKEKESIN